MDQIRRGNYDSGQDYVLEYGELRFTFNERDFSERVEQAARACFNGRATEHTGRRSRHSTGTTRLPSLRDRQSLCDPFYTG